MMPAYRFRKRSRIELMMHDAWTDLIGAVNSVSDKKKMDSQSQEQIKRMKELRRHYRKGEIIICDGDPELLFSAVIKQQVRMVTSDNIDK